MFWLTLWLDHGTCFIYSVGQRLIPKAKVQYIYTTIFVILVTYYFILVTYFFNVSKAGQNEILECMPLPYLITLAVIQR